MIDCATIGIVIATTHLGTLAPGLRQTLTTPGAYCITHSGITIGAHSNTMRRTSAHLGYTKNHGAWGYSLGIMTGYGRPRPYAAISVRFGGANGARIIWMPHRTGPVSGAIEVMQSRE